MSGRLIAQTGIVLIVLAVVAAGLYLEIIRPFEKQRGRM